MGKCLFMRKGETHTAPVNYKANFADNTWEQIIDACQKNAVPDTWLVGDQKTMTINGTDYPIDIIGKNHDDYSDGSGKAPLTFQMHDCYATRYKMNNTNINSGGWTNCVIRKTRIPALLLLMPNEVQTGIKEVHKLTSAGDKSSTINTTSDKLFLLSEIEFLGLTRYAVDGEGTQYEYYKAGNSTIKKVDGVARWHWTRSPAVNYDNCFCAIRSESNFLSNPDPALNDNGISLAFCF